MSKTKATTLKDIAERVGVSAGLVSYVLNGRGDEMRISKDMQQRVLQTASDMHYRTNVFARMVRSNTEYTPVYSFFWPYQSNAELLNACFAGIHSLQYDERQEFDMILQLYESHQLFQYETYLRTQRTNGALVYCTAENDWAYIDEHEFSIPIVILNHYSEHCSCAYVDPAKVMETTAKLIAQAGYSEIGLLFGPQHANQRKQAKALNDYCIKCGVHILEESFEPHPLSENGGISTMERMLTQVNKPPKLIVSFSTRMAKGASYLLLQKGFKNAQDYNLLVVSNSNQMNDPTLSDWSTIQFPIDKMCSWSIEKLIMQSHNPRDWLEQKEFSAEFHMRDGFFK